MEYISPIKRFMVKNMGIPERLKESRHALGLSQAALADAVGATKRSVINWEGGTASPSADVLSKYAQIGTDTTYILTGQRAQTRPVGVPMPAPPAPLPGQPTAEEIRLLSDYRLCDAQGRAVIRAASRAAAEAASTLTSARRRRKG